MEIEHKFHWSLRVRPCLWYVHSFGGEEGLPAGWRYRAFSTVLVFAVWLSKASGMLSRDYDTLREPHSLECVT